VGEAPAAGMGRLIRRAGPAGVEVRVGEEAGRGRLGRRAGPGGGAG
jgi:hypothetical protein